MKYETKLEFLEGLGAGGQSNNHPWGRYGYSKNHTMAIYCQCNILLSLSHMYMPISSC